MVTDEISLKSLLVLYGTGPSYQDLWTSLVANLSHVIERRDPASRRLYHVSTQIAHLLESGGMMWHQLHGCSFLEDGQYQMPKAEFAA